MLRLQLLQWSLAQVLDLSLLLSFFFKLLKPKYKNAASRLGPAATQACDLVQVTSSP